MKESAYMGNYKTEKENFLAGKFEDGYTCHN